MHMAIVHALKLFINSMVMHSVGQLINFSMAMQLLIFVFVILVDVMRACVLVLLGIKI